MDATSARLATRRDDIASAKPEPETGPATEMGEPLREVAEEMRRRFRRRAAAVHALWGLAFGYVVLHPMAMAAFRWFELRGSSAGWRPVVDRIGESFSLDMLPMGFVFALFSLVIGSMDGYYRSVVRFQRDDLAAELEINEAYRQELEIQNAALHDLGQMKRRMTRFLVHDLKNHIGCVMGYSNLLLKRARAGGWRPRDLDALVAVSRQATRMEGAVRDILELAKLEHQPELDLHSSPAVVILREAVVASAVGPGEGTVVLDDDVPADLLVDCDPALIVRVLANLVVNAVRHNEDDVVVTLGAHEDPWSIVFTCADTGQGIPEEIRGQLFDEFTSSTGEDEETPSYGLGLAFCRAAVEAHGGKIWFESQLGEGTTFLFAFPRQEGKFGPSLNNLTLSASAREALLGNEVRRS